jgi:hypothetical protein
VSQLKLGIIMDSSKFRAQMSAVQKDLYKFRGVANTVGKGLNKALSTVGIAAGFTALTSVLKNSAKAASEDIKSQALLANSLRNTIGATDANIAAAEAYIKKTQLQTAVLDDELRPALQQAVLATGSLGSGQRLLNTALNVSAGTGKDLSTVTGALSKAFNGNTASLKKLVPGLDVTGNFLATLDDKFRGAAETAADNDPYRRLQVIFADLQETIGTAVLPALEEFSAYLASPEGQRNLQQIAGIFKVIGTVITTVTSFIIQNIAIVKALVGAILFVKIAWGTVTLAVKAYEIATKLAKVSTIALRTALISTGIGALVVAVGLLAEAWINAGNAADEYDPSLGRGDTNYEYRPGVPLGPGLGPNGEPFLALGYESYEEYAAAQQAAKDKVIEANKEKLKAIKDALEKEMKQMKSIAEKFRDDVGLAFGTFGKDENSVFNIDIIIAKMKRVASAAKGFAQNVAKLRAKKVPQAVIDQLVAMGPAQGNIVAKGLLASGTKLSTFLGLSEQLYGVGAGVAAQQAITPNATYEININKAVISAADIIKEIRILEKKTGRKYLVN